jgi:hypothetical protein
MKVAKEERGSIYADGNIEGVWIQYSFFFSQVLHNADNKGVSNN